MQHPKGTQQIFELLGKISGGGKFHSIVNYHGLAQSFAMFDHFSIGLPLPRVHWPMIVSTHFQKFFKLEAQTEIKKNEIPKVPLP